MKRSLKKIAGLGGWLSKNQSFYTYLPLYSFIIFYFRKCVHNMDTPILPRLIHRTEYETHLFLNMLRICFLRIRLIYQYDFAWGRVESIKLGFKSKSMRCLFARI